MKFVVNPIFKNKPRGLSGFPPAYVFEKKVVNVPSIVFFYYRFLLFLIKVIVKIRLGIILPSYKKYTHDHQLTNTEIEKIYHREAKFYEIKHHLTTNFRDIWWRRLCGFDIVSYVHRAKKPSDRILMLDLATGVGLSMEEMLRVFKKYGIAVDAVAADYNEEMLAVAEKEVLPRLKRYQLLDSNLNINFVRADAMDLRKNDGSTSNKKLAKFNDNFFDCITIMFGMGGIENPIKAFADQLHLLKAGGILSMIDIHSPYSDFYEHWPFFIYGSNKDIFGYIAWQFATVPLVLRTLFILNKA